MSEDEIIDALCAHLTGNMGNVDQLNRIEISNSTTDAVCIGDLIGTCEFSLFKDNSDWNTHPGFMIDVAGGVRPDIVIRSKSGQNRILIEAKSEARLRDPMQASQVVRYFLHLLFTSLQSKDDNKVEIRRAVLMAAPEEWFKDRKNAEAWGHFLSTYTPLASVFGITLGEVRWKG